jgi:hypothetical protein
VVTQVLSERDAPDRGGISDEGEGVRQAMEELKVAATGGAQGSEVGWRQAVRESMELYEVKVR